MNLEFHSPVFPVHSLGTTPPRGETRVLKPNNGSTTRIEPVNALIFAQVEGLQTGIVRAVEQEHRTRARGGVDELQVIIGAIERMDGAVVAQVELRELIMRTIEGVEQPQIVDLYDGEEVVGAVELLQPLVVGQIEGYKGILRAVQFAQLDKMLNTIEGGDTATRAVDIEDMLGLIDRETSVGVQVVGLHAIGLEGWIGEGDIGMAIRLLALILSHAASGQAYRKRYKEQ